MNKISRLEVYQANIGLSEPFTVALGTVSTITAILIKIEDSKGNTGWGEASPTPIVLGDTPESVISCIDLIAPRIMGEEPIRIERIHALMNEIIHQNTSAKAAIDIALYDLMGKIFGQPLGSLLGGGRDKIETDACIGIKDPEGTAKGASQRIKEGFKVIKVKVGLDPDEDLKRIELVREEIGRDYRIRIDANQGWTPPEAVRILRKMQQFDIELVEQPVKWYDVPGLGLVRRSTSIPVMADESVHQPQDALEVLLNNAVDYINIKLMKSSGINKALKIAAIAGAADMECIVGQMFETNIATTAAAHLATALNNIYSTDLDSELFRKEDPIVEGGARIEEGYMVLPDAPGLGINVKQKLLGEPIKVYKL
jgi:L-alanine-DL-glutamate epimerase-like enolase superfamily enzyme